MSLLAITAFHGSLDSSISRFRIATHFGSPEQALSAIGAKRFLDEEMSGTPALYEVMIQMDASHVREVSDWGAPGARGALSALQKVLEADAPSDKRECIARRFNLYYRALCKLDDSEVQDRAAAYLAKEAVGAARALKYSNMVELNGIGYCVLDPSVIAVKSITSPKWNEVINAFKTHNDWPRVAGVVKEFMSTNSRGAT